MYAEQIRKCTECKNSKSESTFYNYTHEHRCKECISKIRKSRYVRESESIKLKRRAYAKSNPDRIKDTKLKQAFNLTLKEYNQKLIEQNGVCAICKKPETAVRCGKLLALAVDHNHKTKVNRGLLCVRCNRALGLLEENLSSLVNMIRYILKYLKLG